MRRTNTERSAQTQKRLLQATLESLVAHGYVRMSTVDVARRAGVSRGALLHHFPTKADLVTAAVEFLVQGRHHEFRNFVSGLGKDPQLSEVLEALWTIYSGPTLHAWMEMVIAARTDDTLRGAITSFNARFVAEAEETFGHLFGNDTPAVKPAARLLMATLDGLAMNQILENDQTTARATLKVLEALIQPWL